MFVSYTHRETEDGDGDIELAVLDAATMQIITRLTLEDQAGDQHSSSINVNNGHLVFSWTDENAALEDGNGDANGSHVSVAMGDIVETIVGDDTSETLTGTDLASQIFGEGGNDTLYGGSGPFNYLYGGTGDDIYIVGSLLNTLIEKADEGRDTVRATTHWVLEANVERLELMSSGNINGTGNDLDNTLVGNASANVLDGGNGDDYMFGGRGYDIYHVDSYLDRVVETTGSAQGGYDTVRSTIDWELSGNVEVLQLLGSATKATGNASNNSLHGNALDNYINGMSGDDFMSGGSGNDIYIVASANDSTSEGAGRGTDTVRAYINWTLANNVERLELKSSGNLNGTVML
jgi:Ca2+-binding RTX toxin-like protein